MRESHFEQLGGESALRAIIDVFVDRCFADPMIGFFFAKADKTRVKAMEYTHAAHHLGAEIEYAGRPISQVHQAHPIRDGHFNRRRQILTDVLNEFGVRKEIQLAWLEHQEDLRGEVINRKNPICGDL